MCGLSVYIKTTDLREEGGLKKSVLKELEELGGRVDLKPLVRDYVAALGDVHELWREMIRTSVEASDHVFLGAIDRFKSANPSVQSVVGLAAIARENGRLKHSHPIFRDIVEYRQMLQRKNQTLVNLGRRYVTGEALKKADK